MLGRSVTLGTLAVKSNNSTRDLIGQCSPMLVAISPKKQLRSGRNPPLFCALELTPVVYVGSPELGQEHAIGSIMYDFLSVLCVFFPFILVIKFVGRTSRGHTGGRSHRISHPPSFCGA